MDEAVEIRRGKLKRLDTDEVAEKLSPDEVEEFRDAFEVGFAYDFFVFAFKVSWEVETILKTKGSHRCLTKMETEGSVWLNWARWWQTLAKMFPLRSTKFWSLKFDLWLDGYMGENRRKASSPKSLSILTAGARRYSGGAWCRPEWGNRFCRVSSIHDRVSYIWLYLVNQLFVFNFGNKTAKAKTATQKGAENMQILFIWAEAHLSEETTGTVRLEPRQAAATLVRSSTSWTLMVTALYLLMI